MTTPPKPRSVPMATPEQIEALVAIGVPRAQAEAMTKRKAQGTLNVHEQMLRSPLGMIMRGEVSVPEYMRHSQKFNC